MWEILVQTLLETLQRKRLPRRKFVQATKRLYDCMNRCQEEYLSWEQAKRADESAHGDIIDNSKWREAIENLILALWEMRDVLDIFAPPVSSALRVYVVDEVENYLHPSAIQVESLGAEELKKYELLVSSVWMDSISGNFNTALGSLREFMQKNFTPEDLYL